MQNSRIAIDESNSAAEETRIRDVYRKRSENDARYSWFNPAQVFLVHQLERKILLTLRRYGSGDLSAKTILEVGCGTGHWLREFVKWGARPENVTGIDLLPDRLSKARLACAPAVRLHCASAAELPFADERFDIVFQATVFTSILDAQLRRRVAAELLRVVKSGGLILWYDYHVNNPSNADVRAVNRTEIYRLFPNSNIDLTRITLAPPITRVLAPYSYLACYLLESISLLSTHYLGVIRKR